VTVLDQAHQPPKTNAPAARRLPRARMSPRSSSWAAGIVRAAAVLLPVALVLEASGEGPDRMLVAWALIAGIWFLAITTAVRAVSVSPFAVGVPSVVAMGTLVGFAGVSAAGFWLPWIQLKPLELTIMAMAVFATSTLSERITVDVLMRPRRTLVVGSSERAIELVAELADRQDLPFEYVGVVDDLATGDPNGMHGGAESESTMSTLTAALRRERPDLVVLADEPRTDDLNGLLDAGSLGFRIVELPAFYEHAFGRVPVHTLSPMWFMSVLHLYQRPYSRITKRIFDIAFAGLALVVLAPVMLVVAALICLFDRGPVLYRQVRLGEGGETFRIVKFRTMVVDAEARGIAIWAQHGDPRITPVGRVLRKARLDELPQFWNVLRGDMSVVGPRPERPEFLHQLADEVPFWTRRHLVKPGITGWAQVRHSYASDVQGTTEKLGYDLYYLKHRSLFLDTAIVAKTVKTVFSGSGAL
jgi:exopolysaccharide biosynthesis polyprenyl glycosylphosphotransferase